MVDLPALSTLSLTAPLAPAASQTGGESGAKLPFSVLLTVGEEADGEPKLADSSSTPALPASLLPNGKILPEPLPILATLLPLPVKSAVPVAASEIDIPKDDEQSVDPATLPLTLFPTLRLPFAASAEPQAEAAAESMAVAPNSVSESRNQAAAFAPDPASTPAQTPVQTQPAAPARGEVSINLIVAGVPRPLKATNDAAPPFAPVLQTTPAPVAHTALDFAAPHEEHRGEGEALPGTPRLNTVENLADAPVMPTLSPAPMPTSTAEPAITAPAAQPTPARHEIAQLIDRLVEARDAAQASQTPQVVHAALRHAEFGAINLRIAAGAQQLDVSLTSADPDFARTVQAAAPAQMAANTQAGDHTPQGQQPGNSAAAGGHTNSGQNSGSAQPRAVLPQTARTSRDAHAEDGDTSADPRRRGILA